MKLNIFILCIFLILFGCQQSNRTKKSGNLPVIDIYKNYPQKEIHLQEIADIEYIPLETTDDVLLGQHSSSFYISEKYILVRDLRQGTIFIFNRKGKIVFHFNHQGPGDKEYNRIAGVIFDEKKEEIFIIDIVSTHRILVYSLTGEYKRTLKYSDDLSITGYNFDDETLLVYDENGLFQNQYNKNPYFLMSKKDGSIVSVLNINLPTRYSNRGIININVNGRQMTQSVTIGISNNIYYGQDFVIANISSDTIYQFTKDRELRPFFVRTPSVHSSDPRIVWTPRLTTDKFIILDINSLDFNAAKNNKEIYSRNLIYEFSTEEICDILFINDDFPLWKWHFNDTDIDKKNVAVNLIQTSILMDALEKKQLRGKLLQSATTLDADDNPIIMIVKFK